MSKNRFITGSLVLLTGALLALPTQPARAQRRAVQPERRLLGISLGSSFMTVIRRYGQPSEIQTVALSTEGDQLPGLSGGGGGSASAGGAGYPGMMGSMMGGPGMRGGAGMGGPGMMPGMQMGGAGMMPGMPRGGAGGTMGGGTGGPPPGFAGMMGGAGMMPGMPRGGAGGTMGSAGIPSLPPVGGAGMMPGMQMGGAGMMPGMMGGPGMRGGMGMRGRGMDDGGMGGMPGLGGAMGGMGGGAAATNMPEYSTATLWIYKRPSDIRLEFLINEDGRVAQISVAAPAASSAKAAAIPGARTSRGVTMGTPFSTVTNNYGYPERFRMLPGLRFYETYFTKDYHAAFTFDTLKNMKCVRITIALAD